MSKMTNSLLRLLWLPGVFLIITVAQIWVVEETPAQLGGLGEYLQMLFWHQFTLKMILTVLLFFGIIFNRSLNRRRQLARNPEGGGASEKE